MEDSRGVDYEPGHRVPQLLGLQCRNDERGWRNESRDSSSRASYRGFLFADLRGYTDFVDRRGNAAVSALLDDYRGLVRAVLGRRSGSEIRTEGDSFFVVFDSASDAVEAALEITHEAAAIDRPDGPIHVGVGVHAGETIATAEGFVGAAVNLAARLCSFAKTGEVLVSDTVRQLTRAQLPYQFERRTRRRLKGLAEPVTIYRVLPSAARPGSRRWSRQAVALLGAAAIAGFVVLAFAALRPPADPTVTRSHGTAASTPATASAAPGIMTPNSASISPAAAPTATSEPFPNSRERALIDRMPPDLGTDCRRDLTRLYSLNAPDRDPFGFYVEGSVPIQGIKCDLPLGEGARTLWLREYLGSQSAANQMEGLSVTWGAEGDACGDRPTGYNPWLVGGERIGMVTCRANQGDPAWIAWSYEDDALIASAVNDSGDWQLLHGWWRSTAPFLTR